MVHLIWRINKDPDDWCIPLLTSFGDIFGVSLLYLCFHLVYLIGDENIKITTTFP
jgi:cation transporter-like permease